MPKALLTQRQREADEDKRADEALRREMRATMGALGVDRTGFAAMLGICPATLYRRIQAPASMTLEELRRLERLMRKAGIARKTA